MLKDVGSLNDMDVNELEALVVDLEAQLATQKAAAKWTRDDIKFIQRRIFEREQRELELC